MRGAAGNRRPYRDHQISLKGGIAGIEGCHLFSVLENFVLNVKSDLEYLLDPSGGSDFILAGEAGSPGFGSIDLPTLPGVTSYNVRYEAGGSWSSFQTITPGVQSVVGPNTNSIEFDPIDSNGNGLSLSGSFLVDVSFASDGTFTGTLNATGLVAAPGAGLVNDSSLTPAVSGRLPTKSLVTGGKIAAITQSIRLTNNGASAVTGPVTLSILLSTDNTGASGGDTVETVPKTVKLKAGKSVSFPVVLRSIPSADTGTLYLLAEVADPSGNTAFSASAGTISAAAPFIDLAPTLVRTSASVKAGKKGIVSVTLINNGNVAASGNLAIDLQASTGGTIDSGSIDLGTLSRPRVVIQPGRKLTLSVSEAFPLTGGPYYVVANVDPADTFSESILSNNVLASGTTVKLTGT